MGWGGLKEEREGEVDAEMYEEVSALQLETGDAAGLVSGAGADVLICFSLCLITALITLTVDVGLKLFVWSDRGSLWCSA